MMRRYLPFIAFAIFILFASCASVSHYEIIDDSVAQGDFQSALDQIRKVKEDAYRPKDAILYYLDEGLLAHYAGDYSGASTSLGLAERGIEQAVTKSISLEASSFLVNDTTREYSGEDYEDIYLNVFNALNYYYSGSTEGALVEIRRIDNKIKYLSTKYGGAITNAQKALLKEDSVIPYDTEAATIQFSNSALGRYLGMLFYRSEGKFDDARIDRDQVKLSFANQQNVYQFPLPSSLDDELIIPQGKARLNVLSFTGLSPIKTESVLRIPLGAENWIKIALPVIIEKPSLVAGSRVVFDSGESFELELIEDMSAVAIETFKKKAALIYLKTVLRSVAKTTSAMALESQADSSLLFSVLSVGTQLYAEASEQADLRMSRYFPSKASVGGISLEPGIYSYTVEYYNASGALIHSVSFTDQKIMSNTLNLSEAICIR